MKLQTKNYTLYHVWNADRIWSNLEFINCFISRVLRSYIKKYLEKERLCESFSS